MKNERLLLRDARYEYPLSFDAPSFKMAETLLRLRSHRRVDVVSSIVTITVSVRCLQELSIVLAQVNW